MGLRNSHTLRLTLMVYEGLGNNPESETEVCARVVEHPSVVLELLVLRHFAGDTKVHTNETMKLGYP